MVNHNGILGDLILRVNLTDQSIKRETLPEHLRLLGGRGLTSAMVAKEVPPRCHGLDVDNKLVIAPGLLAGTRASSCSRLSVGAKSPLTGTIKEANAGGTATAKMARLGLRALIIEGRGQSDYWYVLRITADACELIPANEFAGMGVYETTEVLLEKYPRHAVMCIGPAGEMRMTAAGIAVTDIDGVPSRYAARGGLGAVMGSKGLKAILLDDSGTKPLLPTDPEEKQKFIAGAKILIDAIQKDGTTHGSLPVYGTLAAMMGINEIGALPTRNFSTGQFEGAIHVSGDALAKMVSERGGKGKMGHPCYPGCAIRCSNIVPDEEGEPIVGPLEYESAWALGPNCGIDSLDAVSRMNWLCNDIGVDTIEIGNAIGVVMDAGVLPFGDVEGAIQLLEAVRSGDPIGRIIGQGAATAARVYGVSRVSSVKGQAMPAYDPRVIKGIGVVFATSTQGADHTIGYTIDPEVWKSGGDYPPESIEGKIELARRWMIKAAAWDAIGACNFLGYATTSFSDAYPALMDLLGLVTGDEWSADRMNELGEKVLATERTFNREAGFNASHDRLPEFFSNDPLPPKGGVFDVPDADLDRVFDFCDPAGELHD
jgi:aldehyde:ferredoxin oxidoreductase